MFRSYPGKRSPRPDDRQFCEVALRIVDCLTLCAFQRLCATICGNDQQEVRPKRDVFEYFSNRPTIVCGLVTERIGRLLKPRIDFTERVDYRISDFQYCLCVRHEPDSINSRSSPDLPCDST